MECIDIKSEGPAEQNFIFGYGSLIEDESRQRTTPSARDAWPAKVEGIRRGWWARGAASGLTTTYLGAIADPKANCNGVIYKVSAEELAATDKRESAGYQRCRIETDKITWLDGRTTPLEGVVWAYINRLSKDQIGDNLATPQFPIVQSYVDICIHGCLEVEGRYPTAAGFTQDFIATTEEWNQYWINDRVYPRRPFIFQPAADDIDKALQTAPRTAKLFYEVEIEPARWEDLKPVRPKAAQ
jgi:cation transport regulator ChaC